MISVTNLTVAYDELVAVAEVSLQVPPGYVLAVSGPSGAGKSSLLWAIAGAAPVKSGEVQVDGLRITGRPAAAAHGVVLIPQGNGLARVLTARENLSLPLLADRKLSADEVEREEALESVDRIIERALTAVGLEESGDHLVEELSGGEQQRVAVARGLAQRGKVILADESTSELDSSNRERVLELLRAEADRGAAVIIATHDPSVAAGADGHATMDEGRLSWERRL
ncbi:putative ABC transport system ATP-binding protein [Kribbella orskensis]|uniref:ABC transport system ATP-binding protein n=1 Tax=Kribbella orskensis TaxID=2512216 RepID=A0ABY2BB48_9ACTN|nr:MULTISPECIES: ATP-binding cassette domain-containing protein [Kribbella]TCN34241.1 putative ABC transport system ATP-binding protein [Kribbella sp. VKM Ac-2500]TCO14453.1 putative ABC transport system ATP-binding protein [Kribbella orskensis]